MKDVVGANFLAKILRIVDWSYPYVSAVMRYAILAAILETNAYTLGAP